jgi:acid stress-induced BolA-like protein IbaG/YrbA
MMKPEDLIARVRGALPDAQVELAGADCSFELHVVSEQLRGQTQVARQRMLLALFAGELSSGALHALSIRARAPNEL